MKSEGLFGRLRGLYERYLDARSAIPLAAGDRAIWPSSLLLALPVGAAHRNGDLSGC